MFGCQVLQLRLIRIASNQVLLWIGTTQTYQTCEWFHLCLSNWADQTNHKKLNLSSWFEFEVLKVFCSCTSEFQSLISPSVLVVLPWSWWVSLGIGGSPLVLVGLFSWSFRLKLFLQTSHTFTALLWMLFLWCLRDSPLVKILSQMSHTRLRICSWTESLWSSRYVCLWKLLSHTLHWYSGKDIFKYKISTFFFLSIKLLLITNKTSIYKLISKLIFNLKAVFEYVFWWQ